MVDTPERIYADRKSGQWFAHQSGCNYVRSDLADTRIVELEAEVERTKKWYLDAIEQRDKYARLWDEALSRTGAVKVKALEWEETYDTTLAGGVIAEAESALGDYRAWGSGLWRGPLGGNSRHQGDLQTAKAAAQADYERRILAALEPAAPEGEQEVAGCEWCVDGLQADGETPCPTCTRPSEQAVTEAEHE